MNKKLEINLFLFLTSLIVSVGYSGSVSLKALLEALGCYILLRVIITIMSKF